jgi:hypothetical protein
VTLAPLISPGTRGIEGKPGDVKGECASPGCTSPAQQRHHMWSRSYLGGVYEWVEIEGQTLQNTVGLCVACHLAVTGDVGGHRAHIRYDAARGVFEWWARGVNGDDGPQWFFVGYLKRKGLVDGQPEAEKIRRQEGLCPECGHPLKTHGPKHAPGPKRKVSTWGVVVPADEEVGSDVMDDWIETFATLLGFGEASTRLKRYHVLAIVLSWAAMNKEQFLRDLEEAEFWGGERS